ncbi:sugar O-acetyltransferase [Arthrobacter sp. Sa2BUA2]|uniref:Sugar O-acetyltransferase n=1 Tax=Arthrobacter pullicola TaxID=2762224 RepID=A0ABR8YDS4_9MICC|nr:sugar O-acetyltransferase [Arthrobacter pullicola]MBD8042365.1 sugar O-acetyltransferase [Arthrobacter pullicola]
MTDYFEGDQRSMRERMQAGDLYIADDAELAADSRRAISLADRYTRLWPQDPGAAVELLNELLGAIGADTEVRPPLYVDYGKYISIGERTFINYNFTALDVAPITIGDDVQIGPNVQLLTPTHPLEPGPRRDKLEAARPISIGNNVWLGGGVIVLPGVSIGENTVVGAGAVVTKDLPPNVVAVGNPARTVRELDADA